MSDDSDDPFTRGIRNDNVVEILPPNRSLENIDETSRRAHAKLWRKGESGNPSGLSRAYSRARQLARTAAPEMIESLIDIVRDKSMDERVRSFCAVAVLDRAGVKPIDYDPSADPEVRPKLDVEKLSPEERQMMRRMIEKATAA